MELREPQRKKKVRSHPSQPLPLIYNDNGELTVFTCHLSVLGTCIVDPDEMEAVSSMGFFGKGSLSRNQPKFGKRFFGAPPIIRQRQHERRRKWMDDVTKLSKENIFGDEDNQNKEKPENSPETSEPTEHDKSLEIIEPMDEDISQPVENQVLVLPDSDENNSEEENYLEKIVPRIEKVEFPVHETLHLTFEETFFLVYALGCLQVVDVAGKILDIGETWEHFCKESNNFVERYVVYHYFRSKSWVVKPALKYGGDFLLYKDGPPFYHASYIVVIDFKGNIQWTDVFALERLGETISKEILIVQVQWPNSIENTGSATPELLPQFTVKEILLRRWIPKNNNLFANEEEDDEEEDSI